MILTTGQGQSACRAVEGYFLVDAFFPPGAGRRCRSPRNYAEQTMLTTVTQERRNAVNKHTGDTVVWSNSLAGLAARIRVEHEAVAVALRDSVRHAIVAGELLVEAKAQLVHGQWRPWLREHCAISERTAQLYMRVAKNRAEIEAQIRNDVADLTLSEAAALLMLSSDARKL
jgi:hypothetical protein